MNPTNEEKQGFGPSLLSFEKQPSTARTANRSTPGEKRVLDGTDARA